MRRVLVALGMVLALTRGAFAEEISLGSTAATDSAEWARVNGRAVALYSEGRCEEALATADSALRLANELHKGDHPDVAVSLNNMAYCLQTLGRSSEALPLYEQALDMQRALFSSDEPIIALSLRNLANCLKELGRPKEAVPLLQESLDILRRLFPEGHALVASNLSLLARNLESLGRNSEALPLHRQSLEMRQRLLPGDNADAALSLSYLSRCLVSLGRTAEAVPLSQQALDMYRRLLPHGSPTVATAIVNYAGLLSALGRNLEALPLYQEALVIRTNTLRQGDVDIANTINLLALCLNDLGRSSEALPLHQQALLMRRQLFSRDHPDIATSLNNIGACLSELGRLPEALELFQQALEMHRRIDRGDHATLTLGLNNVAHCLSALGRSSEALQLYQQALEMRRQMFKGDHADVAISLNNLAVLLQGLGRSSEALSLHQQALQMYRRLFAGDHPDIAVSLSNTANCLSGLHRSSEALPLFQQALEMSELVLPPSHPQIARRLASTARHTANLGKTRNAIQLMDRAMERWEDARSAAMGLNGSDRETFLRTQGIGSVPSLACALHLDLGEHKTAAWCIERGRGRALLDLLESSRFDPLAEARRLATAQHDASSVSAIDHARVTYDSLSFAGSAIDRELAVLRTPGVTRSASERLRADTLLARLRAVRAEEGEALRQRAQLIRNVIPTAKPSTPAELQSLVRADERLLMYSLDDVAGAVFVIPRPGEPIHAYRLRWPSGNAVTSDNIARRMTALLAGFAHDSPAERGSSRGVSPVRAPVVGTPSREVLRQAHELFRALVPDSLWQELTACRRIYLVPSGPLTRLPFEALVCELSPTGEPVYWLDRGPMIAYGHSGSVLRWCEERARQQQGSASGHRHEIVALGDPVFRTGGAGEDSTLLALRGGDGTLPRLPGTRTEVTSLCRTLTGHEPGADTCGGGSRVATLLGECATEARLRELAPQARMLHLATHHLVDEYGEASYCRLALTMPEQPVPGDDGYLSLRDLLDEPWRDRLSDCELVVLSACETQVGEVRGEEGMYAIPWGFLYAGAPRVLASQWKVADLGTAELMATFYQRLEAEPAADKLSAFTEARRTMRTRHPDPYYWAPFVMIGCMR